MLCLNLVRFLVLRETIHDPFLLNNAKNLSHADAQRPNPGRRRRHPCLVFLPTREVIHDTYRVATIARDMGIDFFPDKSLSAIIFSASASALDRPLVSLPFPSLSTAPISRLRRFVRFSKGLFGIASSSPGPPPSSASGRAGRSPSLFSRVTRRRIDGFDAFARLLTSRGWSLFRASAGSGGPFPPLAGASGSVGYYVFRKVEANRVRGGSLDRNVQGEEGDFGRVRELRLPDLDFRDVPLKVLHYILLMTDDIFYLA